MGKVPGPSCWLALAISRGGVTMGMLSALGVPFATLIQAVDGCSLLMPTIYKGHLQQ